MFKKLFFQAKALPELSSQLDADIPRYPPFLKGLPAASPEDLQSTQEELIAKLRQVEDRIQAFFDVLYQVFTRFALLMVWLPFALILMLPALWDGLMTWKIKKTTFDFSSPIIHRYSMIILGSGIILLFMGLFAPLAIPPVVLPSMIIGLALMAGLALSHLQKKI